MNNSQIDNVKPGQQPNSEPAVEAANVQPHLHKAPCCTLPFVQLWNEDCLETLKRLPTGGVDLMLQDPPYGVTDLHYECDIPLEILWKEWLRVTKDTSAILFTSQQPFSTRLINSMPNFFKYEWIWEKSAASNFPNAHRMPMRKHENILVFYRKHPTYNPQPTERSEINKIKFRGGKTKIWASAKGTNVYAINKEHSDRLYDEIGLPNTILAFKDVNNRNHRIHPNEKPIELMRYFIKTYSNEGDIVFDGYSGSGTTAAVCIKEKRHFIGSELNKEYYDLSVKRLTELSMQTELF